jgi:hypothetical protein
MTDETENENGRGIARIIGDGERANAREWMHLETRGAANCAEIGALITRADLAEKVARRMASESRTARVTGAEIDLAMAQGALALATLRNFLVDSLVAEVAMFATNDAPPEVITRWRALARRFALALEATTNHADTLVPPGSAPDAAARAERDIGSHVLNALSEEGANGDYAGMARVVILNAAAGFLLNHGGPDLMRSLAAAAERGEGDDE